MKMLICGPYHSGSENILTIVEWLAKNKSLKLKIGTSDTFDVNDCDSYSDGLYVICCHSLESIYTFKNKFDVIFLPIRDVRDTIIDSCDCGLTESMLQMLKNVMLYNMWKLSAHYIIKYEEYNCEQIQYISSLIGYEISYSDALHLTTCMNDDGINTSRYTSTTNEVYFKPLSSEDIKYVHSNKTIYEYLKETGYLS